MKPASHVLAPIFLALLLPTACSPKPQPAEPQPIATHPPEPQPTASPVTSAAPFFGHWRQSSAALAPWWSGKDEKPEPDPEFASVDTVLTPTTSYGPGIVHCEEAVYTATLLPPDALFSSSLTDPSRQAAALGFKAAGIPTLVQSCRSSTGDLQLIFHLVDADTILLALNDIIYTLKRVPEPPGGWPPAPAESADD